MSRHINWESTQIQKPLSHVRRRRKNKDHIDSPQKIYNEINLLMNPMQIYSERDCQFNPIESKRPNKRSMVNQTKGLNYTKRTKLPSQLTGFKEYTQRKVTLEVKNDLHLRMLDKRIKLIQEKMQKSEYIERNQNSQQFVLRKEVLDKLNSLERQSQETDNVSIAHSSVLDEQYEVNMIHSRLLKYHRTPQSQVNKLQLYDHSPCRPNRISEVSPMSRLQTSQQNSIFSIFTPIRKHKEEITQEQEIINPPCKCGVSSIQFACVRGQEWMKAIQNNRFNYKKSARIYYDLIASDLIENKYNIQIKRDLNRTYPTIDYFKNKGQDKLYNVLKAFSIYDQEIGYVQGMNFIAGALLYHCDEVLTFWLIVELFEQYDIREMFRPGLPGLYSRLYLIDKLIELKLPKLNAHLVRLFNNRLTMELTRICLHQVGQLAFLLQFSQKNYQQVILTQFIFLDRFFELKWSFFYNFVISLCTFLEPSILSLHDLSEILSFIKSSVVFARVEKNLKNKIKEIFSKNYKFVWESVFEEADKEFVTQTEIKELLFDYNQSQ